MKNILLIIIVIIAVVLGGLWAKTLVDKSKDHDTLTTQISELDKQLKDKTVDLESTNKLLASNKAKFDKVSKELKAIKEGQLSAAKEEIAKREDKINQLETASKDLQSKLSTLNKQLEGSQEELEAKDKQVSNFKQIIEGKDTRIGDLNKSVNSWQEKEKAANTLAESYKTILLENKIPVEPEKKFAGHILTVHNDPDFVIIDIGIDDSLPVGQELKVVRDNHFIGKVTVQKLLPEDKKLSTASVISLVDENNTVRQGDIVKN